MYKGKYDREAALTKYFLDFLKSVHSPSENQYSYS